MNIKLFLSAALMGIISCGMSAQGQDNVPEKNFPFSVQFSPVPSGEGWHGEARPLSDEVKKATIQNFIDHGVTHINSGGFSGSDQETWSVLEYAQSRGIKIDCMSGGMELFHRQTPPANSVFTQEYHDAMAAKVQATFGPVRNIEKAYTVFPFMDEPFHADTTCFDYREPAMEAFQKEYGYAMPASFAEARKDPLKYMDFINFQSSLFSTAWKQIYDEVKKVDSRPTVTLTHDSHNTLGAGANSNAVWAVDDVFHWGADFADMFIYDIYPYMCEDYRVGESALVYKPRMSQLHWTIAQMRNLTETYGKTLGFWVGTYNHAWFKRFMDDNRRGQYWMERELSYTAIGGGANYLITGFNVPEDGRHWDDFGEAMSTVQKEGGSLVDAKRPKAKACFLFPRTQHVLTNREYFNVALTFELCMRAFGEMDVIHEEQITDDSLNGYEVLVLADVEILPDAVAGRIKEFVNKGGTVIADCVPQKNEALQETTALNEVFGISSADTYRIEQQGHYIPCTTEEPFWLFMDEKEFKVPEKVFDQSSKFKVVSPRHCVADGAKVLAKMKSGEPLLMTNKYGNGKVFLFGFCLEDTYLELFKDNDETGVIAMEDMMRKVFKKTGAVSSTYSSNPYVEVALRKADNEAFAIVINHEAADPSTKATIRGLGFKVGKVIDVNSGEEIKFRKVRDGIRFASEPALESEGGITRLYKILPR